MATRGKSRNSFNRCTCFDPKDKKNSEFAHVLNFKAPKFWATYNYFSKSINLLVLQQRIQSINA